MRLPCVINLSFVGTRRTGIANYAINLVSNLTLEPALLLAPPGIAELETAPSDRTWVHKPISSRMSADHGKRGHINRLWWTQVHLPKMYHQHGGQLLFSPVPEAPLFSSCRTVVMVHDLIPLRFPCWTSPLTPYFRFYVPMVLQQATHIVCNSKATAQDIMDWFGISARHITPIPLAYDDQRFHPVSMPRHNYFLYVGRHDPHKNLARVLQAFAALPNRQAYELRLVGPVDRRYTPKLMQLARSLGISPQVRWLNYVPSAELLQLFAGAIALVFPSLWEGFGIPVLEAMACGTPVITSTVAALPEVAGSAALLVDPTHIRAIAAAMHQLATDETARSQLRHAGFAHIEHFSWRKTGQLTSSVLEQFL
ncbi:glycosyltransferase family 4 protein [Leptolyngbya sp. AN02str]|uniref:glycosyltransferase family 4 protein n=1 Tax=Leptolyngbya sp. AN02str TaxID=3423363 RepID=UPI003D31D9A8